MGQLWSKRLGLSLLGIAVLVISLLSAPLSSQAATATGSQGIQVSPVIVNLNAENGRSYDIKLTVTNVTAGPLVLTSDVNDFKSKDESGNPQVILTPTEDSENYSLDTWVSPIPEMTLQASESRTIAFTVNVPASAEAGGHYGVIRFSGVPPSQASSTVSLNASVGVLLLARVQGDITEKLVVEEMFTAKDGKKGTFFPNSPVTIVTRVKNTGNVHVQPVGTLVVKNMLGKTVGSYPFGSNAKNVLPGSIRRYEQKFDKKFLFGRYSVNLTAAYGTTGGVLQGSTTFWIIPFKLIIFLIVLIVLVVLLTRRGLKRYRARVIRQHQSPKR